MRARASPSRAARPAPDRGSTRERCARRAARSSCASSSSAPAASSARVRLVEHEQLRVVQQDATEREPLRHPARVRDDAVVAHLPEPVALEQHPDPLAPFGDAVELAVEIEVLERTQLAVDERLVRQVADRSARHVDGELPFGRHRETGADPQQRRLPGAVRAGDDEEAAARKLELDPAQDALVAVALAEAAGREHAPRIGLQRRVEDHERGEDDADHAVHREEGRIEAPQVAGPAPASARTRAAARRRRRRASRGRRPRGRDPPRRGRRPSPHARGARRGTRPSRRTASRSNGGPRAGRSPRRRARRRSRSRPPRGRPPRRASRPATAASR